MQYLGGKARIAKKIGDYIRSRQPSVVFEPFCGALNITAQLEGIVRLPSDVNPYLITLFKAVQAGWEPPKPTRDLYDQAKLKMDPTDPLTGFMGFGYSFGGKFFGGYANPEREGSHTGDASKTIKAKLAKCRGVTFFNASYVEIDPTGLVYCDPPYADTEPYAGTVPFDSAAFWGRAQHWARSGCVVLVSEYKAPPGWVCVLDIPTKMSLSGVNTQARSEKLFEYRG